MTMIEENRPSGRQNGASHAAVAELAGVRGRLLSANAGPRPGDLVYVGRRASVQFSGTSGFNFRVIHIHERATYAGWCWLDGYQLNAHGEAVERRSIYVQPAGLLPAGPSLQRPSR